METLWGRPIETPYGDALWVCVFIYVWMCSRASPEHKGKSSMIIYIRAEPDKALESRASNNRYIEKKFPGVHCVNEMPDARFSVS